MKAFSILIILVMFGCGSKKDNTVEATSPVQFNKEVCSEAINAVLILNGRPAIEVASKVVELTAQKPESAGKITSCLDANVKLTCDKAKCLVAKKNI